MSTLVSGALDQLRHETWLADLGRSTLVTEAVSWRTCGFRGVLGVVERCVDLTVARWFVRRVLASRISVVRDLAETWAARPVVVGTALIHNGYLLAQQRRYPARDAGRWELPGGRVESAERETDAVIRECAEELGVTVLPTGRIGTDVPLPNGMLLRLYTAQLEDPSASPQALEHRELRWVDAAGLSELDWLDADRAVLPALREALSPPNPPSSSPST